MALDEKVLGKMLNDAVQSAGDPKQPIDQSKIWNEIAAAIIEHIKTSGEIKTVVTTNTGSGTGVGKIL